VEVDDRASAMVVEVVCAEGDALASAQSAPATRGPRQQLGDTWLFDPMHMTDQPQGFYWNPLRGITTITDARRLASAFCYTGAETKRDEFFGPKGDDLVACLILAAALDGRTLEDVYEWATTPRDETPLAILKAHDKRLPGRTVAGIMALADKTRSGVYGAAEKSLLCLTDEAATAWVTPQSSLPEFKPEAFVESTDTLYLLCEKGAGSPTPLIAAFTDTIYRYGEQAARRHRGRRLPDPLLSVLDEAANICILEHLASYYSYFGSLGMPLAVFLQSASQGEEAWGKLGIKAMWSHANIRTLGGGLADFDFLEEQSRLVGEFDETVQTTSTSPSDNPLGSRSTSTTTRPKRIYDVADLSALPKGRAVVFASGSRPTMVRTRPWWECDFADAVQASLDQYGPN
jgi:type IV secretory pathway TraG/TraD family ATPase VirD4